MSSFDPELLKILRCPETHQELRVASPEMVEKLNARIVSGGVKNRAGKSVTEKITAGLVRADEKSLYPISQNIPILLVDEAIAIEA